MNKINKFIVIGVVVSTLAIGFVSYTFNYYKTTYNKINIIDWGKSLYQKRSDAENSNIEDTESEKAIVNSGNEKVKEQNSKQEIKVSAENSVDSITDDTIADSDESNIEDAENQTVEETVEENEDRNDDLVKDNPKETNAQEDTGNTNNEPTDIADKASDNSEDISNDNPNTSNETNDSVNQETSDNTSSSEEEVQENNNGESSIDIGNIKVFENEVAQLVNIQRVNKGFPSLGSNSKLSNVAKLKSQDMIDNEYFLHLSPTYGSPFDMMNNFGISYMAAGENIAYGQSTPVEVMNSWMNSEGHRKNILNSAFTEIGIGVAIDANGRYYWTQMFIGK